MTCSMRAVYIRLLASNTMRELATRLHDGPQPQGRVATSNGQPRGYSARPTHGSGFRIMDVRFGTTSADNGSVRSGQTGSCRPDSATAPAGRSETAAAWPPIQP